MPPPSSALNADRNLLFGILAVQMDFISRESLIAAMNAWVIEKQKSLGEILREQRVLADDTLSMLDALVDKHLEVHGGSTERSLSAVPSLPGVADELRAFADADIEATLSHFAGSGSGTPRETPPALDAGRAMGNPTSAGRRFTILRPLARGGLGKLSVARDEELSREVALKEIQERLAADRASVSRFVLEAEVTGGLEHPGIVPVYGLGEDANGRPFYAMRLIRGESLKDAIAGFFARESGERTRGERILELRSLLNRFVAVCNAIEYAHSRGVLHRDLKPSNIMLGKYGETLVVDWGVAKALGRRDEGADSAESTLLPTAALDSGGTQVGAAIGTPQYMSPEQAAGQLDAIGPASDVYSLGATLYSILTGVPPFDDEHPSSVLRKVRAGHFDPPRKVNRKVPPPLDAVVVRAMRTNPAERYPSARALADDVEHWLADEPVSVYRQSLPERLARLLRRRGAQAVAAASVLLLAAVLTAQWLVLREMRASPRDELVPPPTRAHDETGDVAPTGGPAPPAEPASERPAEAASAP